MKPTQAWKRWYLETLAPHSARLVFQGGDEQGPVRVVDLGPYRALYFDSPSCQGRIHRKRPWLPASDYVTSFAFTAALHPAPRSALILGLGPGAVVHTLLRALPELVIHTVELRPLVRQVAGDLFELPTGERLTHVVGDAASFLRDATGEAPPYDLIMVDIAGNLGPSPLVSQPAFWDAIARRAAPDAVVSVNLWRGKEHLYDWTTRQLERVLAGEALRLEHQHIENVVAVGSVSPLSDEALRAGIRRLISWSDLLELNVRGDLEFLLRQLTAVRPPPLEPPSAAEAPAEAPAGGPSAPPPVETQALLSAPSAPSAPPPEPVDPYAPNPTDLSPPTSREPTP
jgi:hypothetical protein